MNSVKDAKQKYRDDIAGGRNKKEAAAEFKETVNQLAEDIRNSKKNNQESRVIDDSNKRSENIRNKQPYCEIWSDDSDLVIDLDSTQINDLLDKELKRRRRRAKKQQQSQEPKQSLLV